MKEGFFKSISDKSSGILSIVALMTIILSTIWWIAEDKVVLILKDILKDESHHCVVFPPSGHVIESESPGKWGTITWNGLNKFESCGIPQVTAVIVNGDGIYHDAPLSITGINVGVDEDMPIRYKFRIPPQSTPGRAWFRVTLTYSEVGRTINSPRVFFQILPTPEGEVIPMEHN